jgi:hypothetical protein
VILILSYTLFGNPNNVGVCILASKFKDGMVMDRVEIIQIASCVDTNVGAWIGQAGVEPFGDVGPGVSG